MATIALNTEFNNPRLPLSGFTDDFTGGGGGYSTLGTTHEGVPWEYPAGQGWFQRDDGTATAIDRSDLAVVDSGYANGYLETSFALVPALASQQFGLAFRVVDANNYCLIARHSTGEHIRAAYVVDGALTQVASRPRIIEPNKVLSVEFSNDSVIATYDGEVIIDASIPHHRQATRHGLYNRTADGSSPWFDYCRFVS